jgi:hypothetical protein
MKPAKTKANRKEMLPQYDFPGGARGKYAAQFAEGTNLVLLDPDVAKVFPNADAVNSSLRALAAIIHCQKDVQVR